jgi:hypothetical protein
MRRVITVLEPATGSYQKPDESSTLQGIYKSMEVWKANDKNARHRILSWTGWIQSTISQPVSWISILFYTVTCA